MSYEHNPRMSSGRKLKDAEQFEDVPPLSSTLTPYSGKRSINVYRVKKNRQPTEKDTLTTDGGVVANDAISNTAFNIYGFLGYSQVIYTITLVALVALQASTALTVKVLLVLIILHNAMSMAVLGMHHKIENTCSLSVDSEHSGIALLRHVRNDRRSTLLFLSTLISCIAAIDIAYISRIAHSLDDKADTFRHTGVNTYVHRGMDVLSMIIFALAVPSALLILVELRHAMQVILRSARVQDSSQDGSDDEADGPTIVSPRQ